MADTPMMKCGHASNAVQRLDDGTTIPVCVICASIDPGARVIDDSPPSFEGRTARCSYFRTCGHSKPSGPGLAFFEHVPTAEFDRYYCGCHGWD